MTNKSKLISEEKGMKKIKKTKYLQKKYVVCPFCKSTVILTKDYGICECSAEFLWNGLGSCFAKKADVVAVVHESSKIKKVHLATGTKDQNPFKPPGKTRRLLTTSPTGFSIGPDPQTVWLKGLGLSGSQVEYVMDHVKSEKKNVINSLMDLSYELISEPYKWNTDDHIKTCELIKEFRKRNP